ncbi:MAG: MarR family transcriptional regulator [Leptospira sp.]|nr:MarR family transcriptional regulator [Leptospira sp.]
MPTNFKGSTEEVESLNAFICLMRASDSLNSRLNTFLGSSNLSVSQFGILECLYHLGPICQKEISTKILKSTANITTVIDNLEKRGLVKRVRQKDDRRYILIHLTDKGKGKIQEIFPEHMSQIMKEMSILNNTEKKTLQKLCKYLGKQTR